VSKVYTKKFNKNISLTDRRQRWIKNYLFYIANIEDTRCQQAESLKEKTVILKQTNTDHHNGDLNLCFLVVVVSFIHFKWLTFKELIW